MKYAVHFTDAIGQAIVEFENRDAAIDFKKAIMNEPEIENVWLEEPEDYI